MRILITNDDGINAPGLKALEQIAHELAGDTGEVWVIAPTQERSGVAHCISYTSPMLINKISERRYSVDGYPADCVLAGLYHIMPERPDVILSGVNAATTLPKMSYILARLAQHLKAHCRASNPLPCPNIWAPKTMARRTHLKRAMCMAPIFCAT